jgi:hypothetical protein
MNSSQLLTSRSEDDDFTGLGDVDELDGPLVKGPLVLGEAIPVGIGAPDDDLAFLEQPLQHQLYLELLVLRLLHAAGDVLEIDEQRQLPLSVHPEDRPFPVPGASIICRGSRATSDSNAIVTTP